jgi:hypothetical protein
MALLTREQYLDITGNNYYNDADDITFNAACQIVQDTIVEPTLPPTMWAKIIADDMGAELTAFYNEYIIKFYAFALYQRLFTITQVQLTSAGPVVPNTQTSQPANGDQLSNVLPEVAKTREQYQVRMQNEYIEVRYVFDGVAYPPVPRMKWIWQGFWQGLNYWNGVNGWGWYSGANYVYAWYGQTRTSANGVTFFTAKGRF